MDTRILKSSFESGHAGPVNDAKLDFFGKILASASSDCTIKLWNMSCDNPTCISIIRGHEAPIWQVTWSHPAFGTLLASCSFDKKVIIWKEQCNSSWAPIYIHEEHVSSVNSVEFSNWECGLHLACGSSDGRVSVLSYNAGNQIWSSKTFQAHPYGVLAVSWGAPCSATNSQAPISEEKEAFSSSSLTQRLATGGCDHQVRVWNFLDSTNTWIEAFKMSDNPHTGWVQDVAWRPTTTTSASLIASCSDDCRVIFWQETDADHWKNRQIIQLKGPACRVSWSVTYTILSVATALHEVLLFKEDMKGTWESIFVLNSSQLAKPIQEKSTESLEKK